MCLIPGLHVVVIHAVTLGICLVPDVALLDFLTAAVTVSSKQTP